MKSPALAALCAKGIFQIQLPTSFQMIYQYFVEHDTTLKPPNLLTINLKMNPSMIL